MGPNSMWWGGGWMFPWGMPILLALLIAVLYLRFAGDGSDRDRGSGSDRPRGSQRDGESAIWILKQRYADGEIQREEFERTRKDLNS